MRRPTHVQLSIPNAMRARMGGQEAHGKTKL